MLSYELVFENQTTLEIPLVAPQSLGFFMGADALQGLGLYLADALAGDAKLFAHLFERVIYAVFKPVPQF